MTRGNPVTIEQRFVKAWYAKYSWALLLYPLSLLFRFAVCLRRCLLRFIYRGQSFSSPVVVVGNITVGGCGKTPLLIALANQLVNKGLRIAIVSRGYAGIADNYPLQIELDTPVERCGDEPLLIKHKLASIDSVVVVDPDRRRGVNYVLEHCDCDLVLCDDGLQHYKLHRDVEIAVIDGIRGFGNGLCLPAGPLREPVSRLDSVNWVVVNGAHKLDKKVGVDAHFAIKPLFFRNLATDQVVEASAWDLSSKVHAVAAIGNPQRFADSLSALGIDVILHEVDDHQRLTANQLVFEDSFPVVITAKDAIKLDQVNADNIWVLEVDGVISSDFVNKVLHRVGLS